MRNSSWKKRPDNIVPWEKDKKIEFGKMPGDLRQRINKEWGPNGFMTLANFLYYVESVKPNACIGRINLEKKYFECKNSSGKNLGIKFSVDNNGYLMVKIFRKDTNNTETYCIEADPERRELHVSLKEYAFSKKGTLICRRLDKFLYTTILNKGDRSLGIYIENTDPEAELVEYFTLPNEEEIYRELSKLSLPLNDPNNIVQIVNFLYRILGSALLDRTIVISNDLERNCLNEKIIFKAVIKNGLLKGFNFFDITRKIEFSIDYDEDGNCVTKSNFPATWLDEESINKVDMIFMAIKVACREIVDRKKVYEPRGMI